MPVLGAYDIEVDSVNPGTSSSITFDVPTGTVEGDVLIIGITTAPGVTVNTPAGWTALSTVNGGTGVKFHTFYRNAPASPPSTYVVTRVGSSDTWCGQLVRINGAETFDVTASSSGGGDTSFQAGLLTGPTTGDIMIAYWGVRPDSAGTPTLVPDDGTWTTLGTVTSSNGFGFPAVTGSSAKVTGTDQPVATANKDCEWASVTVSFKATGAPPADGAFRAASSDVTGTTTATLAWPTGTQVTDLAVMTVGVKPFSATINTPAGWTALATGTNGSTASGTDTGSTKVALFSKIVSSTSGNTTVTAVGSNCIVAAMCTYLKDITKVWDVSSSNIGSDTTNGANYSATGAADLNLDSDFLDILFAGTAVNADLGSATSEALSNTGVTLSATGSRVDAASIVGDDMRILCVDATATAGDTSAGSPVFTYTNASSTSGTTGFLRIRTSLPAITATFNNSLNSPGWDLTIGNADVAGVDTFTIERQDLSGQYPAEPVRGLHHINPSAISASDYEVPFVSEVKYVYVAYNEDGVAFTTIDGPTVVPTYVSAPSDFLTSNFYIKDVFAPNRSIAAAVMSLEPFTNPGTILGEYHVLGRREPVVFTDLASGRRGSISVLSTDAIGNVSLAGGFTHRELFNSGSVLLLQSVKYTVDIPDMYFVVDSFSEKFLTRPNGSPFAIEFSVSFIEVDRPQTLDIAVSSSTWNDLFTDPSYANWGDVNSNNATWVDVLARYS